MHDANLSKYAPTVPGLLRAASLHCALFILVVNTSASEVKNYLDEEAEWYRSEDGQQVAANILSWQSPLGGWPKNLDTADAAYTGDPSEIRPTFDNGATIDELRFLARAFTATGKGEYKDAFIKGLRYVLNAQYPTGGWPQRYPPGDSYQRHITFNDNAMVRLMQFLQEIGESEVYNFLDDDQRRTVQDAFDRGIDCILQCQVEVDGKLTAWCAQHDEQDFRPRPARSYELVSLSGAESAGIVRLLMSLEDPSPEVVRAVEAAVGWFESAQLSGIRIERQRDPNAPRGFDKVVVEDPDARPLWARFYDIETNRPIFCDRDGVPQDSLSEIGYERRTGYAWYGRWPRRLLDNEYPNWREKWQLEGR